MRLALLIVLAPALARADVNLLTSAPTTVAVSSTVDNAAIVPEHLVDGKLDTAWNSRTDDLARAWVAVRVPKTAHVTKLRLTVGFTKGDFFTQNQRIKRVAVLRDGKELARFALDPDKRELQDLVLDADGGDFTIAIVELVPGSKPAWREVAISELEVWGTFADPKPQKPVVRVGSLDVDCGKALFPQIRANKIAADDILLDSDVAPIAPELAVCVVRHGAAKDETSTGEAALVKLGAKPTVVDRVPPVMLTNKGDPNSMEGGVREGLFASRFVLTPTETAVIIESHSETFGPMLHDGDFSSTLYRITKTGLVPVMEFKSTKREGESEDSTECKLEVGAPRKPLPDLDLTCTQIEGRWHHEDPRGDGRFETPHTDHYRWKDGRYLPR